MNAPKRPTHNCGACGVGLFSARWADTGLLVHVELNAARGDLEVVPELPGVHKGSAALPHVAKARRGRATALREHVCARARAFSAASFNRKRRP